MRGFYYFQSMVDLGVAFMMAGITMALEIQYWVPVTLFGVYLFGTHAKNTYDFLEFIKSARKAK